MTWEEEAACRGVDSRIFFPAHPGDGVYREALTYCTRCEVREECLQATLIAESGNRGRHGMFGGTTPRQRSGRIPMAGYPQAHGVKVDA